MYVVTIVKLGSLDVFVGTVTQTRVSKLEQWWQH